MPPVRTRATLRATCALILKIRRAPRGQPGQAVGATVHGQRHADGDLGGADLTAAAVRRSAGHGGVHHEVRHVRFPPAPPRPQHTRTTVAFPRKLVVWCCTAPVRRAVTYIVRQGCTTAGSFIAATSSFSAGCTAVASRIRTETCK